MHRESTLFSAHVKLYLHWSLCALDACLDLLTLAQVSSSTYALRMQRTSESLPLFAPVLKHSSCVVHFVVSFVLGLRFVLQVTASALLCDRTNNTLDRAASQ